MNMQRNYQGESSFNYEAYLELIKVLGELTKSQDAEEQKAAEKELKVVDRRMQNLVNYVSTVDDGENHIRCLEHLLEGEDLRAAEERANAARKAAHNAAIDATNILNRLAARHCNGIIFTGDATDRLAVADFCLDVTVKLFNERRIVS